MNVLQQEVIVLDSSHNAAIWHAFACSIFLDIAHVRPFGQRSPGWIKHQASYLVSFGQNSMGG